MIQPVSDAYSNHHQVQMNEKKSENVCTNESCDGVYEIIYKMVKYVLSTII